MKVAKAYLAAAREPRVTVMAGVETPVAAVAVVERRGEPETPEEARDSPLTKPENVAVRVGLALP